MGVPLKWGRQNSNFLTTHARHIKFMKSKNLEVPKWRGPPQTRPPKFKLFNMRMPYYRGPTIMFTSPLTTKPKRIKSIEQVNMNQRLKVTKCGWLH